MSDTTTFLTYPDRNILIYAEGYSRTINMPFNTTRKTIYKGVDSVLSFDIKNQDRKPVNILNKDIMVNIMQVRTGELLVQRRAQKINAENGYCEVTIFASDIEQLDPGFYQVSAAIYETDGIARSLYTDHNRRVTMELEICDGAYPKFVPSIELVFTEQDGQWVSQPLKGNMQFNDASLLHTIQIKVTGFTGTIYAFASLEYSNSHDSYFGCRFLDGSTSIQFNNATDVQGWNFSADARWIRIAYTPDSSNTGTVDKVLYRS
jgi:hypothetical protein